MPKIMSSINVISRCQTVYRSAELPGELSGAHHMYVYAICAKPGRSQEELAKDLHLNKSSVTRAITLLSERGFVRREQDGLDKRVIRVYPTEKMLDVLPRVRETSRKWNELISEGISEEEMEVFCSVLAKITERAKSITEDGGDNA